MNAPPTPESPATADHVQWFTDEVHAHDGQLKAYLRGAFPAVGDAQIGGVTTTITKVPRIGQTFYRGTGRYETTGDGPGAYRGTVDANISPNKRLAFRVNLLGDKGEGWREYSDRGHRAVTLAGLDKLSDATQVRADAEWGYRTYNLFATNLVDNSSYWNGSYIFDGTNALTGAAANAAGVSTIHGLKQRTNVIAGARRGNFTTDRKLLRQVAGPNQNPNVHAVPNQVWYREPGRQHSVRPDPGRGLRLRHQARAARPARLRDHRALRVRVARSRHHPAPHLRAHDLRGVLSVDSPDTSDASSNG